MLRYRLILEPDDNDTILVTSPDIPIVTYGEDEAAALRHAADAVEEMLGTIMSAGEPVPAGVPVAIDRGRYARVGIATRFRVALYIARRRLFWKVGPRRS